MALIREKDMKTKEMSERHNFVGFEDEGHEPKHKGSL